MKTNFPSIGQAKKLLTFIVKVFHFFQQHWWVEMNGKFTCWESWARVGGGGWTSQTRNHLQNISALCSIGKMKVKWVYVSCNPIII